MGITLLILSPTLVVMGMMIQFHIRKKQWIPLFTVTAIVLIFIFHCLVMTSRWYLKDEIPQDVYETRAWFTCLIFPLFYIFLCSKTGEKWISINTFSVLGLNLFNFSNGMTLYLDNSTIDPYELDNAIHIIKNNDTIFNIGIYEFVLITQMVWIGARWYSLVKRMREQNLHFSKKSKTLLRVMGIGLAVSFISIFIPDSVWEESLLFPWIFFIPLSVSITYSELLVSWGYVLTPILDENEEPAIGTISVNENQLIIEIKRLIEDKREYLNGDLKIADVTSKLSTNRNYISQVINDEFGCNFNTYINRLRIRDAVKMIEENPNISLELVATRCGFNSPGAFTKVFKKEKGVNPSKWKRNISKDLQ